MGDLSLSTALFPSREARVTWDLLQGLHLLGAQPGLGWATLGLCSPFSKWPPPSHAWAATPPAWSSPPFPEKRVIKHGEGRGV